MYHYNDYNGFSAVSNPVRFLEKNMQTSMCSWFSLQVLVPFGCRWVLQVPTVFCLQLPTCSRMAPNQIHWQMESSVQWHIQWSMDVNRLNVSAKKPSNSHSGIPKHAIPPQAKWNQHLDVPPRHRNCWIAGGINPSLSSLV